MRRGVQDQGRAMAREDLAQARFIGDVGDDRADQGPGARGDEILLGLIEQRLALIEHDQASGLAEGDLAADLLADAPAGAGDEHRAALDHRADGDVVQLRGRTAQEVLDGNGAEVGGADPSARELGHGRHDQDAQAAGGRERADLADALRALGRQGQDDFRDAVFLG